MTTLANLADRAQNAISDASGTTWSQAVVEEWCVEGIRDYNQHFPRTVKTTIATSADDRDYDLPADFRAMLSVEYPAGEDPPRYLARRSRLGGAFWNRSGYYDVITREDTGEGPPAGGWAELFIGEKPADSETITIEYLADHDLSLSSGDTITIPERHEHIVVDFVVWRAWLELLGAEQQNPTSNSSLMMSQLASNTDRAKRAYVESLARALRAREGRSARVTWLLDKWDRIY